MRRAGCAAVVAFLILYVAGCTQMEPQPLLFSTAPWRDGEMSLYQVTDRNGKFAGTVQYDIKRAGDDGWTIARETLAQGMQETLVADVTGTGFRPRSSSLVRTEDGRTERLSATYAGGQVDLEMTNRRDITTGERVSIPSDSRDQQTLFMLARALPLEVGFSTRINAFLPVTARQTRVTLTTPKQEQVKVPAGSFEAYLVALDVGDMQSELWIGVDPPHPLVKYMDGANRGVFELTEFRPGS